MKESVTKSSGNVFLDLGFPPEEAAILQMRSEIMTDIRKFIKNRKLTQAKPLNFLALASPASRISYEANGRSSAWKCSSLLLQRRACVSALKERRSSVE